MNKGILPWLRGNRRTVGLLLLLPAMLCLGLLLLLPPLYQSTLVLDVRPGAEQGTEPGMSRQSLARLFSGNQFLQSLATDLARQSGSGDDHGVQRELQRGLRIVSPDDAASLLELQFVSGQESRPQMVLSAVAAQYPVLLDRMHEQQLQQETESVLRKLDSLFPSSPLERNAETSPWSETGDSEALILPASAALPGEERSQLLETAMLDGLLADYRRAISAPLRAHVLEPPSPAVNLRAGINPLIPLLASLFSLLLLTPLLYTRYHLRDRISFPQEWPEDSPVSVSASLPAVIGTGVDQRLEAIGDAAYHEALRGLRTRLQLQAPVVSDQALLLEGVTRRGRMLMLVAQESDAGSSLLARHLAQSLGQVERVLLICADMRAGIGTEDYCGLPAGAAGLSHLIAGAAPLRQCVHRMPDGAVDVLPAGVRPPNPQELLASRRFARALNVLRRRYDYIVLDAPAMEAGDDALMLAAHSDQLLYLLRADHSRLSRSRAAMQRLCAAADIDPASLTLLLAGVDRERAARFGYSTATTREQESRYAYRSAASRYLAEA